MPSPWDNTTVVKLLLSAVACDPYAGSETIHGWRACRAVAKDHDVWILTEEVNRPGLERATREGLVPENMHFLYVGNARPSHENRLIARAQSWLRYVEFNRQLLPVAEDAHRRIGFDRAHHITFTTWRVGSPLWKLGIPLIWGPISGTEVFPLNFLSILSPAARTFELFRIAAGLASRFSSSVRECFQHVAWIFAVHRQAFDAFVRMRGTSARMSVFSGWFFPDDYIARLERPQENYAAPGPLQMFASGNLEGRKGVAIALQALAIARSRGLEFTYTVSSRGPELAHLEGLAARLGLSDCVRLGHRLPDDEFIGTLQRAHIYLLPSLREGGGLTLMEAMLAGCVPIVADCGGPGDAVTDECGFKIPVSTPDEMARRIAETLLLLNEQRDRFPALGRAARTRIAEHYTEATFRRAMNDAYVATDPEHLNNPSGLSS